MRDEQKRLVIVISLLTAVSMLGDSMLYMALPIHHQEVGVATAFEVGVLLSANRLIRLPLNPLVSWLYQRISGRTGMIAAVLMAAATTVGYGLTKSFAVWLLLRCLWGVAWTFLRLGAYFTIIAVTNEQNRGSYMGTYNGLYRLGSLVGMLAGGILVGWFGISSVALVFGVLPLFALPFVFRNVPGVKMNRVGQTERPEENETPAAPMQKREKFVFFQSRVVWTVLSGLLIAMIFQGAFTATLPAFIKQNPHASALYGNLIKDATGVAGVIQGIRWMWEPWLAPFIGRLSDGARGRLPLFIGALSLGVLCFALVHVSMPILLWLVVLLGIQVSATALTTLIDAFASDVASTVKKVTFMTIYSIGIDCGAALGPMLSYVSDQPAFIAGVYWVAGLILVVLLFRWLLFHKKSEKDTQLHLSA